MKTLPQPWSAALEATMFSGWIHDHLKPHAAALKVVHPLMLRAIAAAEEKKWRLVPERSPRGPGITGRSRANTTSRLLVRSVRARHFITVLRGFHHGSKRRATERVGLEAFTNGSIHFVQSVGSRPDVDDIK
jgi:hypothetical protein